MNRNVKWYLIIAVVVVGGYALNQFGHLRRTGQFLEDLGSQDPAKVMAAMEEFSGRGSGAVGTLSAAVASTSNKLELRSRAALLLGIIGAHKASGTLQQALSDADPVMRIAALQALGQLRDGAAAPAIRDILADKQAKPEVRAAAAYALGMIGGSDSATALSAVLGEQPPPAPPAPPAPAVPSAVPAPKPPPPPPDTSLPARLAAASALGHTGQAAGITALANVIANPNEPSADVRVAAAYALGDLAKQARTDTERLEAIKGLLAGAKDKTGDVRIAAFCSLAKMSLPANSKTEVAESVKAGLEDVHYWARQAAGKARSALQISD